MCEFNGLNQGNWNIDKGRLCLFRYVYRAVMEGVEAHVVRVVSASLVKKCGSPRLPVSACPMTPRDARVLSSFSLPQVAQ